MKILRFLFVGVLAVLTVSMASSVHAQQHQEKKSAVAGPSAAQLVGVWEVFQTKEPGQRYKASYRGRSFVSTGPHAFTLIMEYRKDGTFKRTTRVGTTETVQEGTWKLSGHELRHDRPGALEEEIMYIRFDNPNQYTSIDVDRRHA